MKKIKSALISVFYKDGLENIVQLLHQHNVVIYSTGGTQQFIEKLQIPCIPVESLTTYPSILGGRVKTLHPSIFGGILGRRNNEIDVQEMQQYHIPEIDLVIVDLYPFEQTVLEQTQIAATNQVPINETAIIEKIDIGGPSMIRAAAKNHIDVTVIAAKKDYILLEEILQQQQGATSINQRKMFAIKAFDVCTGYDMAISNYFNQTTFTNPFTTQKSILRYGENPHQQGVFYGNQQDIFTQLNGKALSYNNLVDVDAALQLIQDTTSLNNQDNTVIFAIIKHTNVCGIAARPSLKAAWDAALAGDPESAFGGVLVCNTIVDEATANAINEIFFEVLIAPAFNDAALNILKSKKNRIVLQQLPNAQAINATQTKSILNGLLTQQVDEGNYTHWKEVGGVQTTPQQKMDLEFANIVCKHLKSNAIALVHHQQLIGKGCGQTSRIDALKQSIDKATHFNFNVNGAVLASDAFFPFDDCVKIAHAAGIVAFIQPGGSIRDADSIQYCVQHQLAMVITELRHFKH